MLSVASWTNFNVLLLTSTTWSYTGCFSCGSMFLIPLNHPAKDQSFASFKRQGDMGSDVGEGLTVVTELVTELPLGLRLLTADPSSLLSTWPSLWWQLILLPRHPQLPCRSMAHGFFMVRVALVPRRGGRKTHAETTVLLSLIAVLAEVTFPPVRHSFP